MSAALIIDLFVFEAEACSKTKLYFIWFVSSNTYFHIYFHCGYDLSPLIWAAAKNLSDSSKVAGTGIRLWCSHNCTLR